MSAYAKLTFEINLNLIQYTNVLNECGIFCHFFVKLDRQFCISYVYVKQERIRLKYKNEKDFYLSVRKNTKQCNRFISCFLQKLKISALGIIMMIHHLPNLKIEYHYNQKVIAYESQPMSNRFVFGDTNHISDSI